jgi:hypothetical protein
MWLVLASRVRSVATSSRLHLIRLFSLLCRSAIIASLARARRVARRMCAHHGVFVPASLRSVEIVSGVATPMRALICCIASAGASHMLAHPVPPIYSSEARLLLPVDQATPHTHTHTPNRNGHSQSTPIFHKPFTEESVCVERNGGKEEGSCI